MAASATASRCPECGGRFADVSLYGATKPRCGEVTCEDGHRFRFKDWKAENGIYAYAITGQIEV